MPNNDHNCVAPRDPDGFCTLWYRCWAGESCPKTRAEADLFRTRCILRLIEQRDAGVPYDPAPPIATSVL